MEKKSIIHDLWSKSKEDGLRRLGFDAHERETLNGSLQDIDMYE